MQQGGTEPLTATDAADDCCAENSCADCHDGAIHRSDEDSQSFAGHRIGGVREGKEGVVEAEEDTCTDAEGEHSMVGEYRRVTFGWRGPPSGMDSGDSSMGAAWGVWQPCTVHQRMVGVAEVASGTEDYWGGWQGIAEAMETSAC